MIEVVSISSEKVTEMLVVQEIEEELSAGELELTVGASDSVMI